MTRTPITTAEFKAMKSQFASMDDVVVAEYLALSESIVDDEWPDATGRMAVFAYTCHIMTIDGLGTDNASQVFATGFSDVQTIKSGSVTLTRFQARAQGASYVDWLGQTVCGSSFIQMLRAVKGGPRVALGGVGPSSSGYAKDSPLFDWGH